MLLNNQLTEEYINTISESNLINECDLIGFHGQTIFHNPLAKKVYKLDTINISIILKKIVYDFRSNDLDVVVKVHHWHQFTINLLLKNLI